MPPARSLQTVLDDTLRLCDETRASLEANMWFGHSARERAAIMRAQAQQAMASAVKVTERRVVVGHRDADAADPAPSAGAAPR